MSDFSGLSKLLKKQLSIQRELFALEQDKTDVLVRGNLKDLDEILKKEQPLLMQSVGVEQKRKAWQRERGLAAQPLKETIKTCDAEEKEGLQEIYGELSRVLLSLQKVNGKNKLILSEKLRMIDEALSLSGQGKRPRLYQKDGKLLSCAK